MDSPDGLRPFIMKVGRGEKLARPLEEEEAYQAMKLILEGGCSEFQIGAFLAAMRIKSETPEETSGFIRAVKEAAPKIHPRVKSLLDFGDPYDGKTKSLNLSPLTAVILAAAGCPVILHGDHGIPAKKGVGAGAVFEALGAALDLEPQAVERSVEELGIAYIHASFFLTRFEELKPLRLQYGLRSSLNVIEKMWNPADAPYLAVGIYHAPYFESTSRALLKTPVRKGLVVQGLEGFAELRLHRPTKYVEVSGGQAVEKFAVPADFGFSRGGNWEMTDGMDTKAHARVTRKVLEGEKGAVRDGALFNAGVKLFWNEHASSVEEGMEKAREALDSGGALAKLEAFVKFTRNSISRGTARPGPASHYG